MSSDALPRGVLQHFFILMGSALGAACVSEQRCTDDARSFPVTVTRELAIPFADASRLSFESCADALCEPVREGSGNGLPSGFESSVKLFARADGTTRVEAEIVVQESTKVPTQLSVRATDRSGTRVLDVSGQLRWERVDGCHVELLSDRRL